MFKDFRQIKQEFRKLIKPPKKPKMKTNKGFFSIFFLFSFFFFGLKKKG